MKTGLLDDTSENLLNPYSVLVRDMAAFTPKGRVATEKIKTDELPSLLHATEWHLFIKNHRGDSKDVTDLIRLPMRSNRSLGGSEANTDRGLLMLLDISEAWVAEVKQYWLSSMPVMQRMLDGYPV